MSVYLTTNTELTLIADAIRSKVGISSPLSYPIGFINAIDEIKGNLSIFTKTITMYENSTINQIGPWAFCNCSSLTQASFPECTIIGDFAFQYCTSLTQISFPKCTTIGSYAFSNCSSLTQASFPKCTTIGDYAFNNCITLSKLYLMGSTVITRINLDTTPIGNSSYTGTFGSIYVPSSMVQQYKANMGWRTYSDRFVGI